MQKGIINSLLEDKIMNIDYTPMTIEEFRHILKNLSRTLSHFSISYLYNKNRNPRYLSQKLRKLKEKGINFVPERIVKRLYEKENIELIDAIRKNYRDNQQNNV